MIRGRLLTQYFLTDGIQDTEQYRALTDEAVAAFESLARDRWLRLEKMARASESETVSEFITPVTEALGWAHLPHQRPKGKREDIPDALLFLSEAEKLAAQQLPPGQRYSRGVVVVEHEARDTVFDRAGARENPAGQIIRYTQSAALNSQDRVQWGLLTNGRYWRWYYAKARTRSEYIELELPSLLNLPGLGLDKPALPQGAPPDHWLRVFLLLFRVDALTPASGTTFLDFALAEGRRYEQRVTDSLSRAVFDEVFPQLVRALGKADSHAAPGDAEWRGEVRDAALQLLFRMLFLMFAEDRDLLPREDRRYKPYGFSGLREAAAKIVDDRLSPADRAFGWWARLNDLFVAIDEGNVDLGLPPYNGGLFQTGPGHLLSRARLGDKTLAPLIDAISRVGGGSLARRIINYRDLSVQQLGGIYERLLEREPAEGPDGLVLQPNAFARRTTGSYYTPDELVQLILRRTVGPLLNERRQKFEERAAALKSDKRPTAERLLDLARDDPAEAFLTLRVCDPAMGSGHFLVALSDYLTTAVIEALEAKVVTWGDYVSPLRSRLASIRKQIMDQATANGWLVRDAQLGDIQLIRRIVLKRCIYGVDLNPMAVELAKLSLWLHSFTVGAPLSFLDHHLRCGDSLFGEFFAPVAADLNRRYGLSLTPTVAAAQGAAKGMTLVEQETDADLTGVAASESAYATVREATAPLRAFLDLWQADRWLPGDDVQTIARKQLFNGGYGNVVDIAGGAPLNPPRPDAADIRIETVKKPRITAAEAHAAATAFVAEARALARERRFVHWEAALPGVWEDWSSTTPRGGFDAVIGNPPWDRMKMQEVEWFADRVPAIARQTRAADRKRAIAELSAKGDPVTTAYDKAARTAERAASVARSGGAYPKLSGGDVNLYSLFVERAARLARADGLVGLLVPSGISADLTAAPFFSEVAKAGRLSTLFDFENRRTALGSEPFFPDVDSRFKFTTLVFGGTARVFAEASCAFFQQSAMAAEKDAFALTPADFAAVNPNTGTAPIFRTRRDADTTRGIYARLPVLVDRRQTPPARVWPVRYMTMFHMTNDSGKFLTEAALRAQGAYQVANGRGRWKQGETVTFHPLIVGRALHQFDHRAASVIANTANIHNPYISVPTSDLQHADSDFFAQPQFWVDGKHLLEWPGSLKWAISIRDITNPTNARTVIAAIVPRTAAGNTAPILLPEASWSPWTQAAFLANLNSLVSDYVGRQKMQGTHLNSYILEQLPVVPALGYDRRFGPRTAREIVLEHVLALTYTAHDLEPFARDLGYDGPPFRWDAEDRLQRRARLDALFFLLYGLDRDDAEYVLGTFPIVAREEAARWGSFRSRTLILNMMAALEAGDPDAAVAG